MALKGSFREWNEVMVRRYNPQDYIFHANFLVKFVELKRFKKIKNLLQVTDDDYFLDIGCGSGYLLNQVACKQGIGVDISDLMVKIASENCKIKGKSLLSSQMPKRSLSKIEVSIK
jgi:SAM-dependent methyltransferase